MEHRGSIPKPRSGDSTLHSDPCVHIRRTEKDLLCSKADKWHTGIEGRTQSSDCFKRKYQQSMRQIMKEESLWRKILSLTSDLDVIAIHWHWDRNLARDGVIDVENCCDPEQIAEACIATR